MFQKNIRVVYFYLVALITLIMTISGAIWSMNCVAELIWPQRYDYSYYEPRYEEDYTEKYVEQNSSYIEQQKENTKNRNIKNVINSSVFTVVSLVVFVFHFKKAEKDYIINK